MACKKVKVDRFDVLNVNKRIPLKKFLESKKIVFEKGRTFYEMTKSEIIQDYKVGTYNIIFYHACMNLQHRGCHL